MKILHVITGLERGGAETQLARLVSHYPAGSAVFSIRAPGPLAQAVRAAGVPLYTGNASSPFSPPGWIVELRRVVRRHQPDIVCGWMYHGNLAALVARRSVPVVWNIRHSMHDVRHEKPTTRYVIRAGAALSALPARIFYNSAVAARQHEAIGYRGEQSQVIPNGFDTQRFRPDPEAREMLRKSLQVGAGERLIGVVGRSHPMKNHAGFLAAFARVRQEVQGVRAVIVGRGVDVADGELAALRRQLGLDNAVHLLPDTPHPERLYPGLDLLVLPSLWGEAFPNVVGEAMASEVPCLVTEVGDAAAVVADTGFVAASGEPAILAARIVDALRCSESELAERGRRARQRVETNYSAERVALNYHAACEAVLGER